MKKLILTIATAISIFMFTTINADTQDNSGEIVPTRYGEITVGERDDYFRAILKFNDNNIEPEIKIGYGLMSVVQNDEAKPIQIQNSDVILISTSPGGASGGGCPGKFVFLTVSENNIKVSPEFGTCYDEHSELTINQNKISFTQTNYGGSGQTEYYYKNGNVYKNEKLISESEDFNHKESFKESTNITNSKGGGIDRITCLASCKGALDMLRVRFGMPIENPQKWLEDCWEKQGCR